MADSPAAAGGFLPASLLSPPPSSHASSSAIGVLPRARAQPLRPGGPKESSLIRYVDQGILRIQRRFAKREVAEESRNVVGYKNFKEAANDIESLIDVVWISGTPSVQIPYLLNLALLAANFLPDLPPSPKATFRLLSKLDLAFASLLQGRNVETGEPLPGFGNRTVNGTEKVRIKSLVDRTRICVVEAMSKADADEDDIDEEDMTGTETEDDPDDFNMSSDMENELMNRNTNDLTEDSMDEGNASGVREPQGDWDMHVAKVYDRTVVELGDTLGGTPIGIISDP
ncbi:hypothetical protein NA57DRAFT_37069 [Rhizodiscina lignyota]|uniref:Meiotic recombination protein DMC1 n=1 Tax=Rhizodiscina lignyota TaxID=1504668 RepID=A0A9P4IMJ7_9PEZI|nr:hypothetical protein NA57DRAFT_37069 [Rhizodiscina lignyota]